MRVSYLFLQAEGISLFDKKFYICLHKLRSQIAYVVKFLTSLTLGGHLNPATVPVITLFTVLDSGIVRSCGDRRRIRKSSEPGSVAGDSTLIVWADRVLKSITNAFHFTCISMKSWYLNRQFTINTGEVKTTWTANEGIQQRLWLLENPFFRCKRNHCTCVIMKWTEKQTNTFDPAFSSSRCKKLNKQVNNITIEVWTLLILRCHKK